MKKIIKKKTITKKIELNKVFKAIDDEEELPGEVPEPMKSFILIACRGQDVEYIVEMMRAAVRATKKGIRERVETISKEK